MKKVILFLSLSLLASCSEGDEKETVPEIPTTILKLKIETDVYETSYFYNTLGFVDSIAQISNYGGNPDNFYKKFTYQNGEIVSIHTIKQSAYEQEEPTDYLREDFEYVNGKISKKNIYNSSNELIGTNSFIYNETENSMEIMSSGNTTYTAHYFWQNGNIVKSTLNLPEQQSISQYQYDNKYNPHYYMYPKAYVLANAISKNNVKHNSFQGNNHSQNSDYIIKYNAQYFPVYYVDSKINGGLVGLSSTNYQYY